MDKLSFRIIISVRQRKTGYTHRCIRQTDCIRPSALSLKVGCRMWMWALIRRRLLTHSLQLVPVHF